MTQPLSGQVVLSSIIEGVDTTGTVATFTDTNIGDMAGDFPATGHWGGGATGGGPGTRPNSSVWGGGPRGAPFFFSSGGGSHSGSGASPARHTHSPAQT